jgi:hypothetical protein
LPDFLGAVGRAALDQQAVCVNLADAEQRGIYFPLTASSAQAFDQLRLI